VRKRDGNSDVWATGYLSEDPETPVSSTKNDLNISRPQEPLEQNSYSHNLNKNKRNFPSNSKALTELYDKYRGELTKYIQSKFGSGPPEPDDVVQGSFSKLAGISELQKIKNPKAYLYTVARHYIIDHHKRSNREEGYANSVNQEEDRAERMSPSTAEQVLMGKERLAILIKTLNSLPKKQRRLVILNRFDGLTCQEIGKRENMNTKAVQKQIHRALAKCLNELDAVDET